MSRFAPPDLFGETPPAAARDGKVALRMRLHQTGRKAWLLTVHDDLDQRNGQWLPFSVATRGEGRDADVWTMPRWIAADRGWL